MQLRTNPPLNELRIVNDGAREILFVVLGLYYKGGRRIRIDREVACQLEFRSSDIGRINKDCKIGPAGFPIRAIHSGIAAGSPVIAQSRRKVPPGRKPQDADTLWVQIPLFCVASHQA